MRLRFGLVAAATALIAMSRATPCYADVVVLPDSSATSPMLWIAGLFVVVVSGVSFFLLRRIARRRVAPTLAAPVAADDLTHRDDASARPAAPEAHHED